MAVLAAGLWAVALWPVETKQGIGFEVFTYTIPLYVKALEFVQRDGSYRVLARRIAGDAATPAERMWVLLAWTRRNIRDTPAGFPVIDDHIWHTISRGYGEDDQKADVFTTLLTYAGVPAFWVSTSPDDRDRLVLSFVRIERGWAVVDVANNVVFRNARGELATAEELAGNPAWLQEQVRGLSHRGRPYTSYLDVYAPPAAPEILRAEMQMPWPRLVQETKRLVGVEASEVTVGF